MNLYLRFFNDETLVSTPEQAIDFLTSLPDLNIGDAICEELIHYAQSSNPYPKRFKLSPKVYFIVIKTTAETMEEFKSYNNNMNNMQSVAMVEEGTTGTVTGKEMQAQAFAAENPGWYHAWITFKRVMPITGTHKFRYVDTEFEVRLKARSVQDCYNRVVDHLRMRPEVDARSQFPSIRGRNFKAEFLGME